MSMELIVILALRQAPTLDAWQMALQARHIPVQFVVHADLAALNGFLPVLFKGRRSGFEFSMDSFAEYVSAYPSLARIRLEGPVVYSFEFGGDATECASTYSAAQALVADFGGIAYDPQGNATMDVADLAKMANICEKLSGQGG